VRDFVSTFLTVCGSAVLCGNAFSPSSLSSTVSEIQNSTGN
jgi:hypothetical protein